MNFFKKIFQSYKNKENLSKEKVEKLFEMKENQEKSIIEKLPKILLAYLFSYLEIKEVAKVWTLNKFFLNLLGESNCSKMVWKSICENTIGISEENEVKLFVGGIDKTEFEKRLNDYCLFFKHNSLPKWDNINRGKRIKVSPDQRSIFIRIFFFIFLFKKQIKIS